MLTSKLARYFVAAALVLRAIRRHRAPPAKRPLPVIIMPKPIKPARPAAETPAKPRKPRAAPARTATARVSRPKRRPS